MHLSKRRGFVINNEQLLNAPADVDLRLSNMNIWLYWIDKGHCSRFVDAVGRRISIQLQQVFSCILILPYKTRDRIDSNAQIRIA